MLTISSIAVAPAPQSTPTVRAQPVTSVRQSNAVSRENATGTQVAPQGEVARVQGQGAPSTLAPVVPTQEAARPDGMTNGAAPERVGVPPEMSAGGQTAMAAARQRPEAAEEQAALEQQRRQQAEQAQQRAEQRRANGVPGDRPAAQGEPDFPEVTNPALEALDTQIKEFLPNMWKASRAAVDMVIGEEAVKTAQERAERLEALQARLNARPLANLPPDEAAQSYSNTADTGGRPTPGGQLDQLA